MKAKIYIILIAGIFSLNSCNAWLDVNPSDKLLQKTAFENESMVNTALNGIYMSMADNDAYGENLTFGTLESMAQVYTFVGNDASPVITDLVKAYAMASTYKYNEDRLKKHMAAIWSKQYNVILNINEFIDKVKQTDVISQAKKDILLGEAYGLRAFLHFDMLRMFGPIYSADPSVAAIPYYTRSQAGKEPILKANEVVTMVLADIETSLTLLANDPIKTLGLQVELSDDANENFYRFRNRRFNFYASKMLKARVLIYSDKKSEAATLATEILNETADIFPFVAKTDIEKDSKISGEVFFGIDNQNYARVNDNFYSPSLSSSNVLATYTKRIKKMYNIGESQDFSFSDDMRKNLWRIWIPISGSSSQDIMVVNKFMVQSEVDQQDYAKNFQPLMRKTELYCIIAEANGSYDPLNTVRAARGVAEPIDQASSTIAGEIEKEYYREMIGDGQLFFYYKRTFRQTLESGSSGGATINMSKEKYIVPVPQDEFIN